MAGQDQHFKLSNQVRKHALFSKAVIFLLSLVVQLAVGQSVDDAIATTNTECQKRQNYFFCAADNGVSTNPNRPNYEGFGYCCPQYSVSPNCQDG